MDIKEDLINYADIGARAAQKRKEKGLTQEQLAFAANLSQSTVNKIEKGKTQAELASLIKIANALHMTMDELLCGSVDSSIPVYQKEFAELVRECNIYEMRLVIDVTTDVLKAFRAICKQNEN